MRCVDLSEVQNYDYDINSVLAFPQYWQNGKSYDMPDSGRPDSGLMYLCDCEAVMTYDGKRVCAESGQILYLPQGLRYKAEFSKTPNRDGGSLGITDYLLNFTAKDIDGTELAFSEDIILMTPKDGSRLFEMFRTIAEKSENTAYPPALMKAAAFEIITEVSKQLFVTQDDRSTNYAVSKAIDYISRHCLREEVTVKQLAETCHVSESTLRRMFRVFAGMSPKDYINEVKLRRAEVLLESGGVGINEVARLCGFDDPSYFSRFFKKHTGKRPVDIQDLKQRK